MRLFIAAAWVLLVWPSSAAAQSAAPYTTEIVSIPSGSLKLRGVLGRPAPGHDDWLAGGNGFRVPFGQERPGDLVGEVAEDVALVNPRTGETAVCPASLQGVNPWSQQEACIGDHIAGGWVRAPRAEP